MRNLPVEIEYSKESIPKKRIAAKDKNTALQTDRKHKFEKSSDAEEIAFFGDDG